MAQSTPGDHRKQASLIASIGGHAVHAKHDSREIAARARAGQWKRFEDEVDPDRVLSEADRQRRAYHAMKAHMGRLALKSAKARARRKAYEALDGDDG
jgi:hypothetical protein